MLGPRAVNGQPQRILFLDTPEALDKARLLCTFSYEARYAELAKECISDDKKHNVYEMRHMHPFFLYRRAFPHVLYALLF